MTKKEIERFAFVSRLAGFCADTWAEFMNPTKFERVFYKDGYRIRILIERYETVDDTQPMQTRTPLITEADEQD